MGSREVTHRQYEHTSTRPEHVSLASLRRFRTARRVGIAAIALLVGAGLVNLAGPRTATAVATADGTSLEVSYPQVSRSGLAAPWRVAVYTDSGFSGPVTLTTTTAYFDRFDFNQWYPEPSSSTVRGDVLVLEFERPLTDSFVVRFDGRASPTFGLGSTATTTLETPGLPNLSIDYRTWVLP